MCLWQTRVRGATVCGRRVFLTDRGLKLGFQGPTVEVERFLADIDPVIAAAIREAIPVIIEHHQRRLAADEAAAAEAEELAIPADPADLDEAAEDEEAPADRYVPGTVQQQD